MVKTFCDRCGTVLGMIENGKKRCSVHSFDLCSKCYREYQIFFNEFMSNQIKNEVKSK